jgi:hypothetical protein
VVPQGSKVTITGVYGFRGSHVAETRALFAGNVTRPSCFDGMRECGEGYRVVVSAVRP